MTVRKTDRLSPPAARRAIAIIIVLLHLLLLALLAMRPAPRARDTLRALRWATVRLVPPPAPAVTDPPRDAPAPERPAHAARRTQPSPAATPATITLPDADRSALAEPLAATGRPAPAAAASAASAPAPGPIVIPSRGLARSTSRPAALDDPRANRALESPGERFARELGTDDRRVEEARGEGRVRLRKGTSCVDVKVARDAQLDPFNQSYRPAPRLAQPCP